MSTNPFHCLRARHERYRILRVHPKFRAGAARLIRDRYPDRLLRQMILANALLLLFAGALRGHCPLPNAKVD